mmetsp:Transcript_18678/g.29116  ORF Transcript_18678/g.29116 Transcript_18678/m.29116 type:complete len:140 (+) Transcript_18678:195-614(+)|eukprot:CAMPEP_0184293056 /NCGR_PEP_ID=MMETSP1049-20130417/4648_1 /TAXON_ID=77928 /ORGANISM="Proteomonas sulcata, Strain CCMP704" /LENGTH=139 /DNA_ID=CAMNT_0026600985 /DNA_START=174 /DNA_END=593 /DNA_ORIENTATION=-
MSAAQPPARPQTACLPFRNSQVAKLDAVQWTNQRNLRILLEHITAELLQAEPEDPLMFIWEFLDSYGEGKEAEKKEEAPPPPESHARPESSGGEAVEKMRQECAQWKRDYDEKQSQARRLEQEIKDLEAAIAKLEEDEQ